MIEIRFRDIDPDTGSVSQDKRIAVCDSQKMSNWIQAALRTTVEDDPNREIYQEKIEESTPEEWLNSSLIFARTLGLILKENEGMIVDIKGDMFWPGEEDVSKVIVYSKDSQIKILECEEDLPEGQFVIVHDINPN